MSDISKCDGERCPRKFECYRYVAASSQRQSWFSSPPNCEDFCNYYMPIYESHSARVRSAKEW